MSDWLRALRKLKAEGRDCVRVTVMDVRGSAPREIGATMLVTADDLQGSIGGGRLEYECTRLAVSHLSGRTSASRCFDDEFGVPAKPASENQGNSTACRGPTRLRLALGAAMGQCCGGVVDVLFEHLAAGGGGWVDEALRGFGARRPMVLVTSIGAKGESSWSLLTADGWQGGLPGDRAATEARRLLEQGGAAACLRDGEARILLEPLADDAASLALFGAGHVGSALIDVLAGLDWRVRWIDGRRDIFPQTVPANVIPVESAEPAREVLAMPPAAAYLVMTHSHALDYEICEQVLTRNDFLYCGLIGSRSKRRRFEKRLRGQGLSEARIERLTCPIGLPGLEGKRPAEIAVSVAAQLLKVRQSRPMKTSGDTTTGNVHILRR